MKRTSNIFEIFIYMTNWIMSWFITRISLLNDQFYVYVLKMLWYKYKEWRDTTLGMVVINSYLMGVTVNLKEHACWEHIYGIHTLFHASSSTQNLCISLSIKRAYYGVKLEEVDGTRSTGNGIKPHCTRLDFIHVQSRFY